MSRQASRFLCPLCRSNLRLKSSRAVHPQLRLAWARCNNDECGIGLCIRSELSYNEQQPCGRRFRPLLKRRLEQSKKQKALDLIREQSEQCHSSAYPVLDVAAKLQQQHQMEAVEAHYHAECAWAEHQQANHPRYVLNRELSQGHFLMLERHPEEQQGARFLFFKVDDLVALHQQQGEGGHG